MNNPAHEAPRPGALHRAWFRVYPRPMTRSLRVLIAALLAGAVLLIPAVASAEDAEEAETVEVAPISVESGAAIDVPPVELVEETPPWTTRYLLPLTLTLTVVVVGGLVIYYLFGIKARYTVAAE